LWSARRDNRWFTALWTANKTQPGNFKASTANKYRIRYFPAEPAEACGMGIKIAIRACSHFSRYSGLIHRNILSLFERFEELLSISSYRKTKISSGIPYSLQMSWHVLHYIIEEPTASHSSWPNHQDMTEMKPYVEVE
jgi:hypothetical protein